jgi:hypothetical protein
VALFDKVSDGKGVFEDITRGESLVCLAVSSIPKNSWFEELTISKKGKCFFSLQISESSFH